VPLPPIERKQKVRSRKSLLLSAALSLGLLLAVSSGLKVHAVNYTLTVTHPKGVGGTVTGTDINCGSDCSEDLDQGDSVTLTPSASDGRVFAFWYPAGACSGSEKDFLYSNTCNATMGYEDTTVGAVWGYETYKVKVVKEGSGSGTVTGAGSYDYKTKVTLTAKAASGSKFKGWQTSGDYCYSSTKTGESANTSSTCYLKTDSVKSSTYEVVAKFDKVTTTAPKPEPEEPAEPKPLPLTDFSLNGEKDFDTKPVIKDDKVTLAGVTTPLAKVVLYIHSDPQTVETTADTEGAWSVQVANLESGDHSVEAEVVDPTTKEVSERKQIAEFTLQRLASKELGQPTAAATTSTPALLYMVAGGVMVLGAISAGTWLWLRHKKLPGKVTESTESNPPAATEEPSDKPDDKTPDEPNQANESK
jgi:hypothetical protein